MSSSLIPSTQNKPWWSRTKSSKGPSDLRPSRSFPSTLDDSEKSTPAMPGSARSKDAAAGLRFKTLGSAIGFKSRKPPSLTIQDPPSEHASAVNNSYLESGTRDAASAPSPYTRPQGTTISTTHFSEYDGDEKSSEPRTPSDYARTSYQPSVLTFSEMDPFAAAGVIIQQTSHDPNRLSVYSDSSVLDPNSKSGDFMFYNRISYGSSSSNSHSQSSDSHSGRLASPRMAPSARVPSDSLNRSERLRQNSVRQRDAALSVPQSPPHRQTPGGSNSSSSTLTSGDAQNRLSEPPPGSSTSFFQSRGHAPAARQRGMTIATAEGGSSRRPGTANAVATLSGTNPVPTAMAPPKLRRKASDSSYGLHSASSSNAPSPSPVIFNRSRSSTVTSTDSPISPSATRPLVVVRKASSTRVQALPPLSCAPPSNELPPPPLSPSFSGYTESLEDLSSFPDPPSSSSSSMSFAPSANFDVDRAGDAINHLMRQAFGNSRKGKGSRRKGKGHGTRQNDIDLSPSRTLRNLDLDDAAIPSTSKAPPLPSMRGESGNSSPKVLRKAASQQSIGKRYSSASVASSVTSSSIGQDDAASNKAGGAYSPAAKAPRKQRSFHHSRLPLPPLPTLRHANSTLVEHPTPFPTTPTTEQQPRRGSVTSPGPPSTRKRLFSGSSARRSTSSQTPLSPSVSGDDDVRSIYSVDEMRSTGQKIVMSFGNIGNPLSLLTNNSCVAPSSYLSDPNMGSAEALLADEKRTSQSEYIPQHIMSPADMLKLEQQLADEATMGDSNRHRWDLQPKLGLDIGDLGDAFIAGRQWSDAKASKGRAGSRLSTMSAGTVSFGTNDKEPGSTSQGVGGMSLSPSSPQAMSRQTSLAVSLSKGDSLEASRLPIRSTSVLGKTLIKPSLSVRPSTAQPSLPSPSTSVFTSSHSPEQINASLPPPPRSRHAREPHRSYADRRTSVVPVHPLSPPPVRGKGRLESGPRSDPSQTSRPPSAFGPKVLQHRSIMKKPSFLDIEDELDATTENLLEVELDVSPSSPPMQSSFLDMDRGKDSFDTIRSSDSLLYF